MSEWRIVKTDARLLPYAVWRGGNIWQFTASAREAVAYARSYGAPADIQVSGSGDMFDAATVLEDAGGDLLCVSPDLHPSLDTVLSPCRCRNCSDARATIARRLRSKGWPVQRIADALQRHHSTVSAMLVPDSAEAERVSIAR